MLAVHETADGEQIVNARLQEENEAKNVTDPFVSMVDRVRDA